MSWIFVILISKLWRTPKVCIVKVAHGATYWVYEKYVFVISHNLAVVVRYNMLFLKYSRVNISKFWNSESVFDDKKWIEEKTPSEKNRGRRVNCFGFIVIKIYAGWFITLLCKQRIRNAVCGNTKKIWLLVFVLFMFFLRFSMGVWAFFHAVTPQYHSNHPRQPITTNIFCMFVR